MACSCQRQPWGAGGRLAGVGQEVGKGVGVLLGRTGGVLVRFVDVGVADGLAVFVIVLVADTETNVFIAFGDGVDSTADVGDGKDGKMVA